ncbi:Calcium-binding endonuclease/exonuclease/phosphatase family [Quillaja saponaria]|uniref:Calcium-binding endonuclease/exonuclease/phosphatase family n=1 Tax=Quillaja saponaria TaxID=32244 RepID=A0AAD7PQG1_QUISA|nr:Calcium-binding endonuclease/exonuclease/phosphatase family [Quillaja saponaria]
MSEIQVLVAGSNVAKLNPRRGNDTAPLVNTAQLVNGSNRNNGTISRTKSEYFSSMALAGADRDPSCISCTTFNILAPIYKRIDQKNQGLRESDFRAFWLARNQMILDWLLYESSSIICLQEFWVGNEELVQMYLERLGDAGYRSFKIARTNNRGDGLLTAINKQYLDVVDYRELLLNDFGDRVAQLLHV